MSMMEPVQPIVMIGISARPAVSSGKILHQIREDAEGGLAAFVAAQESLPGPGCVKKGPYRHPAQNAVGIGVTEPNFFWNPFSERP